jgi:hypothetical protein
MGSILATDKLHIHQLTTIKMGAICGKQGDDADSQQAQAAAQPNVEAKETKQPIDNGGAPTSTLAQQQAAAAATTTDTTTTTTTTTTDDADKAPVVTPSEPVVTPSEPVVTPSEPVVTPAEPVVTPADVTPTVVAETKKETDVKTTEEFNLKGHCGHIMKELEGFGAPVDKLTPMIEQLAEHWADMSEMSASVSQEVMANYLAKNMSLETVPEKGTHEEYWEAMGKLVGTLIIFCLFSLSLSLSVCSPSTYLN